MNMTLTIAIARHEIENYNHAQANAYKQMRIACEIENHFGGCPDSMKRWMQNNASVVYL
ncbi:hypothetical protein [Aeromonas hydrophila]